MGPQPSLHLVGSGLAWLVSPQGAGCPGVAGCCLANCVCVSAPSGHGVCLAQTVVGVPAHWPMGTRLGLQAGCQEYSPRKFWPRLLLQSETEAKMPFLRFVQPAHGNRMGAWPPASRRRAGPGVPDELLWAPPASEQEGARVTLGVLGRPVGKAVPLRCPACAGHTCLSDHLASPRGRWRSSAGADSLLPTPCVAHLAHTGQAG